jgi:SAM-dependent methyltransferase
VSRTDDPERTNREFWDADADAYQAAHSKQLDDGVMAWGVWQVPESELHVLGDVAGKDVLELGCGAAQWSTQLADAGARPVGLDQSRGQLRHARLRDARVPLVGASALHTPFRAASFDLVFCDHGAMSFCDPAVTVPEAHRLLRPGGLLAFSSSTLLRMLCFRTDDIDAPITRKLQQPQFGARMFDWGDGTIDYQLPHSEWIRLFRDCGFEIEELLELRAPKGATSTYAEYVDYKWARRWPAEEIGKVRKR